MTSFVPDPPPEISVIVPARDEVVAIGPLVEAIGQVLALRRFEVIVIDDGSGDGTHHVLETCKERYDWLRTIRNEVSEGQSTAIRKGARLAGGDLIVTLDGDGQNPPDQIPLLLARFDAADADRLGLVQGERLGRRDTPARRFASMAANVIRRTLLRDGVKDSGCGMRAFRRAAFFDLPWFDHIHRFMPAMMLREGWDVATIAVTHRERIGGEFEIFQPRARPGRHSRPHGRGLADPARGPEDRSSAGADRVFRCRAGALDASAILTGRSSGPAPAAGSACRGSQACVPSWKGRRRMTRRPGRALRAWTDPPWCSAIVRTSAMPRPVPPERRLGSP